MAKETITVYFTRKVSDFPNGSSVAEVGRIPFATREGATRECVCQWSDLILQKGSKEVDSKNTAMGGCPLRPRSMPPFSVAQAAFKNGLVVNWDVVEAKVDERRLLRGGA